MNSKIIGTGSYIPSEVKNNNAFLDHSFLDIEGNKIQSKNEEIIDKFESITGIKERKYVTNGMKSSDIATEASISAIKSSSVNPETIDYIILVSSKTFRH